MRARRLLIFIGLLLCPLLAQTGLGAGESMRETVVFLNSRESFTGEAVFLFQPVESGEYTLCALPVTQSVEGVVMDGETVVAEGVLPITAELRAQGHYEILLSGGQDAVFEVMQPAHGRSMESPIELNQNTLRYTKSVTSPRDVHWYRYTAEEAGLYTFRTETADETALDTIGHLLDEKGNLMGYNDDILPGVDPNFRVFYRMEAGETVLIRVSALSNDTGLYRLAVVTPDGRQATPQGLTLAVESAEMDIGEMRALNAALTPENAYPDLAYSTSDPDVARVSPEGVVTAVGAGEAVITVSGYGGVKASCRVRVRPIELEELTVRQAEISVPLEGTVRVEPMFVPANASDQRVRYTSSHPEVARVSPEGVVTAVGEGECVITVSGAGGLTAHAHVLVRPRSPVYRALVMSEHRYQDGRTRIGAINTAQGMADALTHNGYSVKLLLDSGYDEMKAAVEETFGDAREGDVCLFYINCHGKAEDGVGYFELHDGARITGAGLEALLRDVPGRVVVLLDFCQSGALLRLGRWVSPLMNGRYLVLTSASEGQDSYRMGDGGDASEAGMATVFARAVCEGGGWDLMRDRITFSRADANRNGEVTFEELRAYVSHRVKAILSGTGVTQSPQASVTGSALVIFPMME